MSCLPGMPCYNSPVVKIVYPPGCDPTPHEVVSSDAVRYDGPNLPCTGVQNGDDLTTALEKIDTKICSEELVASIIQTIENNDVLKAYFCQLVSSCSETTTTTSSSSTSSSTSTTTTTTTIVSYFAALGTNLSAVCDFPASSTIYFSGDIAVGKIMYAEASLTIALLGVDYINILGTVYQANPSTGEIIANLGGACTTTTTTTLI